MPCQDHCTFSYQVFWPLGVTAESLSRHYPLLIQAACPRFCSLHKATLLYLLADLGIQKPSFVWGTPLKGHLSSRVSCPVTEVSVEQHCSSSSLCGVQLPAPLRRSVSKITPPESLLHTVSPCQRLFLREASLQQCDFLEMVLAAF